MHAVAKIAKINRQLVIQIGCHLENGNFGENDNFGKNGRNGTNGVKSPEGWRDAECCKYSNWRPKVAP